MYQARNKYISRYNSHFDIGDGKKDLFILHACAISAELPSSTSTMDLDASVRGRDVYR